MEPNNDTSQTSGLQTEAEGTRPKDSMQRLVSLIARWRDYARQSREHIKESDNDQLKWWNAGKLDGLEILIRELEAELAGNGANDSSSASLRGGQAS